MVDVQKLNDALDRRFKNAKLNSAKIMYTEQKYASVAEAVDALQHACRRATDCGWFVTFARPTINAIFLHVERGTRCSFRDRNGQCRLFARRGVLCLKHEVMAARPVGSTAQCPVVNCKARLVGDWVMCPKHWHSLPTERQMVVNAARVSEHFDEVVKQAVSYVNGQLDGPVKAGETAPWAQESLDYFERRNR